ncbi:MAG: hypothetical protein ABUL72_02765, partial [Armatimonadota bacterium]
MLNDFFEIASRPGFGLLLLVAAAATHAADAPTAEQMADRYKRADALRQQTAGKVTGLELRPNWYQEGKRFWFSWDGEGKTSYISVDSRSGARQPLFDAKRLADAIHSGASVNVSNLSVSPDGSKLEFNANRKAWTVDLKDYTAKERPLVPRPVPPRDQWNQDLYPPDRSTV